jgi:hypothetical protein
MITGAQEDLAYCTCVCALLNVRGSIPYQHHDHVVENSLRRRTGLLLVGGPKHITTVTVAVTALVAHTE